MQLAAELRVVAAVGLGQRGEGLVDPVAHDERGQADLLEHREDDALLLAEQGGQQVVGRDLGVCCWRARSMAAWNASWVLSVQRFGSSANSRSPLSLRRSQSLMSRKLEC